MLGCVCVLGCSGSESTERAPWEIDAASLVPVKGVITLNGKPLARAVVAFMGSNGIPGVAETKEDGRYALETTSLPGALPGDYKVTVSWMVAPDGTPQGLGARSAMVQSEAMRAAVERLPAEYSDLKQTTLSAHVDGQGKSFDFDLVASVDGPKPAEATPEAPGAAPAGEPKKVEPKD